MSDGPTRLQCHSHSCCRPFCPCESCILGCILVSVGVEDSFSLDGLWHGYAAFCWSMFKSLHEEAGTGFPTLLRSILATGLFYEKWIYLPPVKILVWKSGWGYFVIYVENLASWHQRDSVTWSCGDCNSLFYLDLFLQNALRKLRMGK